MDPTNIIATLMGRPLVADPFPLYRHLRDVAPLHREPNGIWYLSRYRDSERVLRSTRFGILRHVDTTRTPGPRQRLTSRMFSYDDPPVHTEKRGLVAPAFSAAACGGLAAHLTEVANELLDQSTSDGRLSIDDLAVRLPVLVTCEMLGIPDGDRTACVGWVEAMTSTNQPVIIEDLEAHADRAAIEAIAYFTESLAERQKHPRNDLLSRLATASLQDPNLVIDDLVATVVLLMAAGFETTRYTIAGSLIELARNPGQLAAARRHVQEDGALPDDAVEELLRHQGPIHGALLRRSLHDESFGDVVVPAGEAVVVMAAAANRDPVCYPDPDRLDLHRQGPRPLAFGHGVHYCLGANLAKVEINAAVSSTLRRFSRLEVAEDPLPKGSFNVRGPVGAVLEVS